VKNFNYQDIESFKLTRRNFVKLLSASAGLSSLDINPVVPNPYDTLTMTKKMGSLGEYPEKPLNGNYLLYKFLSFVQKFLQLQPILVLLWHNRDFKNVYGGI